MPSEIHQYTGRDIVVRWDERLCIAMERCVKALPPVFIREEYPWVQIDAASADEVASAVEQCPTGALQYRRLDGKADEQVDATPSMVAKPAGPLVVRGDLRIELVDGSSVRTPRAMMCGCGASSNRPFCDGAHREVDTEA